MSSNGSSSITTRSTPSSWDPGTVSEIADCLRTSASEHKAVALSGSGSAWTWGGDVTADVIIHTRNLTDVVHYEPSDMTIKVGAGMRVVDLQAVVAEYGQRLALDAPRIKRGATVGGIVATADQGPAQLAFGGPRDLIIGATLVLPDGAVARSGGNVIKNVAGYDLARLVAGSMGTLAAIAEVTVRLHPLPNATGTVVVDTNVANAGSLGRRVMAKGFDPVALDWSDGRLLIRFEGTEPGVDARVKQVVRLLGPGSRALSPGEAEAAWAEQAMPVELAATVPSQDTAPTGEHVTVVRGLVRPTDVAASVEAASRIGSGCGLTTTMAAGLLTGRIDLRLAGGDVRAHAAALDGWRQHLVGMSGTSVLRERADGLTRLVDAWGAPPSGVAVLRAVKAAFDPHDRLGRGRFHPWLQPGLPT